MPDSTSEPGHTEEAESSGPPPPPTSPRRLLLRPIHGGILLVLFLIALLGAVGVFSTGRGTTEAQTEGLHLTLDYPSRFRYKQIESLHVTLRNDTGRPLDTGRVHFDASYIDPFSNVTFLPSATEPWVVELTDEHPTETHRIDVHLEADEYGRHEGQIQAESDVDSAGASLHTFVFP